MKSYERFIAKKDVEKIHEMSLRILSEIGMRFEHEEALEIFRKHGAKVEGETVYIGKSMVEDALKLAKKKFYHFVI